MSVFKIDRRGAPMWYDRSSLLVEHNDAGGVDITVDDPENTKVAYIRLSEQETVCLLRFLDTENWRILSTGLGNKEVFRYRI